SAAATGRALGGEGVGDPVARDPRVDVVLAIRFDGQHLGEPGVDGRAHALAAVAAQPGDAHAPGGGDVADAGCVGHLEEDAAAGLGGERGGDGPDDRDVVVDGAEQHRVPFAGAPGDGGGEDV